ncbi:hypothetical protein [Spiroplasma tabanidicola]|uniref:Lipoprotein n=1 Tax=Spiroplasma tabanidicola TaxID=324079 RepID=A0A6I6C800_9MOLU|nr:hypothetical protein [Spiroplasma tabanidicola]QGS51559.1 hypothetical protein STABA_v1c01920 [Spiroplasma tabanidicola]
MKKLLTILSVLTMSSFSASILVACDSNNNQQNEKNDNPSNENNNVNNNNENNNEEKPQEENNELIDLSALKYKNLPAGYMENGVYDRDNGANLGNKKNLEYKINAESILFSLNQLNKIDLKSSDIEISEIDNGTAGMNGVAVIKAAIGSKSVKGETSLILNQNINFSALVGNRKLNNIYIKQDIFDNLETEIKDPNNKSAFAAYIVEQIGVSNPALEALAEPMVSGAEKILPKVNFTSKEFVIQETPSLNGLFVADQNLKFELNFVKDERAFFIKNKDSLPLVNMELDKNTDVSPSENYISLKKTVYKKLNNSNSWKNKVSLEEFIKFTRVQKGKRNMYYINVIAGSSKLYGHDFLLFFMSGKLFDEQGSVRVNAQVKNN